MPDGPEFADWNSLTQRLAIIFTTQFSKVWWFMAHHKLCTDDVFLLDSHIFKTGRKKPFVTILLWRLSEFSTRSLNLPPPPGGGETLPSKKTLQCPKEGFEQALGFTVFLPLSFQILPNLSMLLAGRGLNAQCMHQEIWIPKWITTVLVNKKDSEKEALEQKNSARNW